MPCFFWRKRGKGPKSPAKVAVSGLGPAARPVAAKHPVTPPESDATVPPSESDATVPPRESDATLENVVRNLWKEAFATLSKDDREALQPAGRDEQPGDAKTWSVAVDKVMQLTKVKYEEYCRRGWHTKKGDKTKETNVRIKAKDIMCSALKFKEVVEAGLELDPTGYGTIVWGVVSGVLTLVQNDKQRAEAVFDSAAVLAWFLSNYAVIEAHYRDRTTQEQNTFEDGIKEVYVAILKYAACVQKQLNQSARGRLLASFWALDSQDIKMLKDDLEAKDKIVAAQSQLVAHQYRKLEFQKLDKRASEALNKIDLAVEELLNAARSRAFNWLSVTTITDKQQQLRSKVDKFNKNSGQWLLESDKYRDWIAESPSFLWLHGASGCGKSSLCSTVVKGLLESSQENNNMIVAYWYFDNGEVLTQHLQQMLRRVLRTISAKATPFPKAVDELLKQHQPADLSPSTEALIKALKQTIAALEEDVFLVMDAVDEYQTGNTTLREDFLDFLVALDNARMPKLHLLVTSIHEADIQHAFNRLDKPPTEIDVEKPVSVDVEAYLNVTVKKYQKERRWSAETAEKILEVLKANRRFRIVSLHLEDLRNCFDKEEIEASLRNVPTDLTDAYLRKLKKVALKDIRRLSHIFYWISVAVRPLSPFELAAAPGVNLDNAQDLSKICPSGMIRLGEITEETREQHTHRIKSMCRYGCYLPENETRMEGVTFDHPSVKRFLQSDTLKNSDDDAISPFFVSEKTVNAMLVGPMLDYLLAIQQTEIDWPIFGDKPFLLYTAQYLSEHFKGRGDDPPPDKVLEGKLLTMFGDPMNSAYLNWMRVWEIIWGSPNFSLRQDGYPSQLYVAVLSGLQDLSKHLINHGLYNNDSGSELYQTAWLATEQGYTEIVQELIATGKDVIRTGSQTILHSASELGNAELVQILLAAGANPNAETQYQSALYVASAKGYTTIVKLLIASNADVNLQCGKFGTALQAAAANGCGDIVAILLDNGAKPDVVGGHFGTAIQAAGAARHSDIVKMLTDRGVAWDEEADSMWHESFDRQSRSQTCPDLIWLNRKPDGRPFSSNTQKALYAVYWAIFHSTDTTTTDGTDPETWRRVTGPEIAFENHIRRQSSEGWENKHFAYKAMFWVSLRDCQITSYKGRDLSGIEHCHNDLLYRLANVIAALAPVQKAIEHSTCDTLIAARQELVECYTLAWELSQELSPIRDVSWARMIEDGNWLMEKNKNGNGLMEKIEARSKRVELMMRPCLEPSVEVVLGGKDQACHEAETTQLERT